MKKWIVLGFLFVCQVPAASLVELDFTAEGTTSSVMAPHEIAGVVQTNLFVALSSNTNFNWSGSGWVSNNTLHVEQKFTGYDGSLINQTAEHPASGRVGAELLESFSVHAPGTNILIRYEVRHRHFTRESAGPNTVSSAVTLIHNGAQIILTNACPQANPGFVCPDAQIGFDNNGNPIMEGCGISDGQQTGFDNNGNPIVEGWVQTPCSLIFVNNGQQWGFDNNGNPVSEGSNNTSESNQLYSAWIPLEANGPADFSVTIEQLFSGFIDAFDSKFESNDVDVLIHLSSQGGLLPASAVTFSTPQSPPIPVRFFEHLPLPDPSGNFRTWVRLTGEGATDQAQMGRTNQTASVNAQLPLSGTNGFLAASATASGNTLMASMESQTGEILWRLIRKESRRRRFRVRHPQRIRTTHGTV